MVMTEATAEMMGMTVVMMEMIVVTTAEMMETMVGMMIVEVTLRGHALALNASLGVVSASIVLPERIPAQVRIAV